MKKRDERALHYGFVNVTVRLQRYVNPFLIDSPSAEI